MFLPKGTLARMAVSIALLTLSEAAAQTPSPDAELLCAVEKLKGNAPYKRCLSNVARSASRTAPARARAATAQEIDCAVEKLKGKAEFDRCMSGAAIAAPEVDRRLFERVPEAATKSQSASAAHFPLWKPVTSGMPAAARVELSPVDLFRKLAPSVYIIVAQAPLESVAPDRKVSQGSAVAIAGDVAITNCHVLAGYAEHFIAREDRMWPIQVVAADTSSDRCLVRSAQLRLEPVAAVRSSNQISIGEKVYAIGSPKGLERTLSEGLVSGFRTLTGRRVVQTSAAISGGSSGGGLFDGFGNLVGITSFKEKESENLNFAIAIEEFWR